MQFYKITWPTNNHWLL